MIKLILLLLLTTVNATTFTKFLTSNSDALCNDGTNSGGYYHGANSNKWMIYLQGGAWCWDDISCKNTSYGRVYNTSDDTLISSRNWPQTRNFTGILSDESSNKFADYNKIIIMYCSSDIYSGYVNAYQNKLNFNFHGDKIVYAIIEYFRMPLMNVSDLLVLGSSAGGLGMMKHYNRIKSLFPMARVRGVNDGGWLPQLNILGHKEFYSEQIAVGMNIWRSNATLDMYLPDKLYANINADDLFIITGLGDAFILYMNNGLPYPIAVQDMDFVRLLVEQTLYSIINVNNIFAIRCDGVHTFIPAGDENTSNSWYISSIDGVDLNDAFETWYFEDKSMKIVDVCDDNPLCNDSCPPWPDSLF
jgi:hypothetical protein